MARRSTTTAVDCCDVICNKWQDTAIVTMLHSLRFAIQGNEKRTFLSCHNSVFCRSGISHPVTLFALVLFSCNSIDPAPHCEHSFTYIPETLPRRAHHRCDDDDVRKRKSCDVTRWRWWSRSRRDSACTSLLRSARPLVFRLDSQSAAEDTVSADTVSEHQID